MRPEPFTGVFREDLPARAAYAEGAGIARAIPAAVAVPRSEDDVATLAAWASATGTPLIPRGSGSGMAGGAVGSGVMVDMSRFDWMDEVLVGVRRVWCGAGALRGAVDARARRHGLRFPVDPSSGEFCTVGGMVAANSAGAHTLRFGATRPWVAAIGCVFADGSRAIVERGAPPPAQVPAVRRFFAEGVPAILGAAPETIAHARVRKEASGYALADFARSGDLVDLLVGSEGTLAIILGVQLILAPVAGATSSLLAVFPSLEHAMDGALLARAHAASACELLDRTFLDVAAQGGLSPVPPGSEAVLLIEVEGEDGAETAALAGALEREMRRAGASDVRTALDAEAESALWSLRHAASPILARLHPALKSMQFIEDAAVPPPRLPAYVRGVRSALAAREISGVIFGHAGDANVHVNPLIDVRRSGWRDRLLEVLDEVTDLIGELGGTLSGEHGDGRLRTPLLDRTWSAEARALFRTVKECFDPQGILNPGVKVPLAGQQPAEEIKYDPLLPPLPAAARAVLERVDRDRAYSSFRLALLEEAG